MEAEILIPNNSFSRRLINFFKTINFINVLVKRVNACRRIEVNCIDKAAGIKKSDIVLDIGSGDGFWTNYFGKKSLKITGVEPYEEHLLIAKRKYKGNCEFVSGSAEALNFSSFAFNKVISICVFEHLFNDEAAFKEIYRVLKPGGKLAATVDSLNSSYISDSYRKKHMKDCYCAQLYSIENISNKLSDAGFKNIRANYIIGSRLAIFYEKLSERIGALSYILLLPCYPFIMLLENKFFKSGYKILVSAEK